MPSNINKMEIILELSCVDEFVDVIQCVEFLQVFVFENAAIASCNTDIR